MNVLIIGSGGREHALAWKVKQSPKVKKIYAIPGNAGISSVSECLSLNTQDFNALIQFAQARQIDLTIVGPEIPLAQGLVDQFHAAGLKIFGPTQEAAQLESSKVFSKKLMAEAGVPTAPFEIFDSVNEAKKFIIDREPPFVIKADGLAAGKGVMIAESCEEGVQIVNRMI